MKNFNFKAFAVVFVIFLSAFLLIKKVGAFPVGVVIVPSSYQQCVNTCLAYNGYDTETYSFCQNACLSPNPVIVVGPVWIHGRYYPRGYGRHFEPRPDYHGRR